MDLWIPISIGAAFFQNLRSALQKHLKGRLSNTGATFSRFAYAAPLALLYVIALAMITGEALPRPNGTFALYALIGGVCPDHRDGPAALFLPVSQLRRRHDLLQDRDDPDRDLRLPDPGRPARSPVRRRRS